MLQFPRVDAQHSVRDHRRQPHLHALDVLAAHPNRGTEPGDEAALLAPAGDVFNDERTVAELENHCDSGMRHRPQIERTRVPIEETGHADTGPEAGLSRSHDVPPSRGITLGHGGVHDAMV